jgi:Na+-driven multidrug efflux pump
VSTRDVNLTDGDLVEPLLVLSLPIVLSQMLQVGYNLPDTFWVGRLGQEAVTALSYSWPLVFLLISVAGGFTVAGTVLVSQHKGAGNDDKIDYAAAQTVCFVGLVALVFSILSLWAFRLPIAYVLVEWAGMGAAGVWYGIATSNVLALLAAAAWYYRGTWASEVIESETATPAD